MGHLTSTIYYKNHSERDHAFCGNPHLGRLGLDPPRNQLAYKSSDLSTFLAFPLWLAQVKNNHCLAEVISRSLTLVYGVAAAGTFMKNLSDKKLDIPSPATLSRARLVLDVLFCRLRQNAWQAPGDSFIYLSMDSSPQNGLDYLMCLQDNVKRSVAGKLVECIDNDDDLDSFLTQDFELTTAILPLGIVASGNSGVAAKFECLFHTLKLECGAEAGPCAGLLTKSSTRGNSSDTFNIPSPP